MTYLEEKTIRDFYQDVFKIYDEDALNFAVSKSKLKRIPKKSFLYHKGDPVKKIYIFSSGFFYSSVQKTKNRKVIDYISFERGGVLIAGTELKEHISTHDVYTKVDSEFIEISFENMLELLDRSEEARNTNIHILRDSLSFYSQVELIRTLTPVKRILAFEEKFANCIPFLTNEEIASFLDINRTMYYECKKYIRNN